MMRRPILAILFCTLSIASFGQKNYFVGGLFFNANGMHMVGNADQYWQNSNGTVWGGGGISGGAYVKRDIGKDGYLSFEMRFIQKGSVYEYIAPNGAHSTEGIRLHYLELPLSIGYYMGSSSNYILLESGFACAKLISANDNAEKLVQRAGLTNEESFKDYDISWINMIKFPLNRKGRDNFLFGFRFSYSFLSVHKYYKLRNMVFGLQLDYLFNN